MRALILGGTTFVGPAVVADLTTTGHDVGVFHQGRVPLAVHPPARGRALEFPGDRTRFAEHAGALRAFAPEVGDRELYPEREALLRTIAWEHARPAREQADPGYVARHFDYAAEDAVRAAIAEREAQ